jgi:hypothetical protein
MFGIAPPQVASEAAAPTPQRRTGLLQLRLRTLFLLTAAVGVWVGVYNLRQRNAHLQVRIAALRPIARELMVLDAQQIAVVQKEQLWYDQQRWEIYVPEENSFRLCLATHEIDQENLAPVIASAPLPAGKQMLELHQRREGGQWTIWVAGEDGELLSVSEPTNWNSGSGSSGGGGYSRSTQLPGDQPAILFRRRFHRRTGPAGSSSTPMGPTEGILLWIERSASKP